MERLTKWLIVAGIAVAVAFAADRHLALSFSWLSVLADAVTVLGVVALAVEYGVYVTERRPASRARQAVIDLADGNPGKWTAAREELVELRGAAVEALRPVSQLSFLPGEKEAEGACARATCALADIARDAAHPSTALDATRALGQAARKHEVAVGRLQEVLQDADRLQPEVAACAATEIACAPRSRTSHLGNMLKHGKQPALFALLALATMSARSDVIIEVEKGLQSNDKDVQAVARFILASSSGDWSPDALLTAVRDGEISVSTAAERALRIMARMHPQNR